jgi:hypothetical protein
MQRAAPSEKIPKNKNAKSEKRNRRNKRQAKRVPKNTRHVIVGGDKNFGAIEPIRGPGRG